MKLQYTFYSPQVKQNLLKNLLDKYDNLKKNLCHKLNSNLS